MRQFIASTFPDKKGVILLTEKERRYLVNVLRKRSGDEVEVRLPSGSLHKMCLHFTDGIKKIGGVCLVSLETYDESEILKSTSENISGCDYWLFQVLPKGQKMDLIVRQATECGVSVIVPVIGEYSVSGKKAEYASENTAKVERWTRIIREAQQQSGSPIDTKILQPCDIAIAMTLWQNSILESKKESIAFMLSEKEKCQESVFSIVDKKGDFSNIRIGFAIGCEGGISPSEIDAFHKSGFHSIHLKTNILRAETAALYSIAALQTVIGEYAIWKG